MKKQAGVSMKKLGILLGVILVAIILSGIVTWFRLPSVISWKLSQKLGVDASINDITFSSNQINVSALSIDNPRQFALPKAFTCETIQINAPLKGFLNKEIIIDSMLLDQIYLSLEFLSNKGTEGNWSTIMEHLHKSSKSKSDTSALIKSLTLTNINIDLLYGNDISKVRTLRNIPSLQFENVSTEEGLPMDQISKIIFREMLLEIFRSEGLQNMLQNVLQIPAGPFNRVLDPIRGLFQVIPLYPISGEHDLQVR